MNGVSVPASLGGVVAFAIHVLVGTIAFVIAALPAVALAALVHYLDAENFAPDWLVQTLTWIEMFIFGLDVIVFGALILSESLKLIRSLEWR